jgi:hypothetical protein
MKFITNKLPQHDLKTGYHKKYMEDSINTKFLGLQIDKHFNRKNNIDLTIPKLIKAWYAVRSMSHNSSTDTLKLIHFAYLHSIMIYGTIFGVIPPTVK